MTITGSVDFVDDLPAAVQQHIADSFNQQGDALQAFLRGNAPRDLGDHRGGYEWQAVRFNGDEIEAALVNDTPNSLFRERGRGPGRQPPIAAIAPWARRKGLNPYVVARSIGKRGTARWRENRNVLGIERDSRPGDIQLQSGSVVNEYLDRMIADANEFEF